VDEGGGQRPNDYGYSVAVDAANNPVVAGMFQGTVNFRGSNLVSAGGDDAFLAKYNSAGTHQWSQRFGAPPPTVA
jgi:hypothetical protein